MEYKHYENCEASICQDDNNPNWKNETIWYPGEKVCTKSPHMKFQKKQLAINKEVEKGTFRNIEEPYTATDLETRSI